jgi:hypothetical protein
MPLCFWPSTNKKQERRIDLIDEDLDAVGCFLEYLYTNDYFPRKITGSRDLERDLATPEVDESGDQLLKHARVYTLAENLQLPALKALASSKIHCVNSTAKGEIAYARYVYAHTQKDDTAIRAPVANFWATRSHTLRSEAENEFRSMCLEFPQFGYDVLSKFSVLLCSSGSMLIVTQPVSWTKNSRERRTTRCTLRRPTPLEAPASVHAPTPRNQISVNKPTWQAILLGPRALRALALQLFFMCHTAVQQTFLPLFVLHPWTTHVFIAKT